jgi:hypothetical protein
LRAIKLHLGPRRQSRVRTDQARPGYTGTHPDDGLRHRESLICALADKDAAIGQYNPQHRFHVPEMVIATLQ